MGMKDWTVCFMQLLQSSLLEQSRMIRDPPLGHFVVWVSNYSSSRYKLKRLSNLEQMGYEFN
jgi:5-methylcytosine-specific restriction endonuclease McrA